MVYDNIILLLACKEAVKRALSRTERKAFTNGNNYSTDGKKLFHGWKEIIPLTGKAVFTAELASY